MGTSPTAYRRTRDTSLFWDLADRDPVINKGKSSVIDRGMPIALWAISWWSRAHRRCWVVVGHPLVATRGVRTFLSPTSYNGRKPFPCQENDKYPPQPIVMLPRYRSPPTKLSEPIISPFPCCTFCTFCPFSRKILPFLNRVGLFKSFSLWIKKPLFPALWTSTSYGGFLISVADQKKKPIDFKFWCTSIPSGAILLHLPRQTQKYVLYWSLTQSVMQHNHHRIN
jgi:hypothetical protein